MSRNVNEAAAGSGEITSNIADVAEVAEKTSRDAAITQKATQQLVQMATQLRQLVERFKTEKNGEFKTPRQWLLVVNPDPEPDPDSGSIITTTLPSYMSGDLHY